MDGTDLERLAIVAEQKEAREQKLVQRAEKQAKVKAWSYVGVAVIAVVVISVVNSKAKKIEKEIRASASQFLEHER